jgi:hypothetical protein
MSLLDKITKQKEYYSAHPEEANKRKEEAERRKAEEQAKREADRLAEEKRLKEANAKEVKKSSTAKSKPVKISKSVKLVKVEIEVEPLLTEKQGIYKYIPDLLVDKTTGENIIFAEDEYEGYGLTDLYTEDIMKELIASKQLNYRVRKSLEHQKSRTKKNAEVFTPSWICKQMIDMCEPPEDWQEFVQSTWLEITCGEGVFLVSPYDATTGEEIKLKDRIGVLDRKLQAINKHIKQEDYKDERSYKGAWMQWVIKAYQTTYGYELQGDNLFIARVNLLQTFFDYFEDKWDYQVSNPKTIEKIIEIITYNIWQMDGLKDVIPMTDIPAKIMDWQTNEFIEFRSCKESICLL